MVPAERSPDQNILFRKITKSATRDIANIILMDSAQIQKKDHEYLKEKMFKYPERELTLYEPLYTIEDVMQTMHNFNTIDYHKKFFPIPEIKAEFYDAVHI